LTSVAQNLKASYAGSGPCLFYVLPSLSPTFSFQTL